MTKRFNLLVMKKTLKRIALFLLLTPLALLLLGVICYVAFRLAAVGGESTPHQAYLQAHKQEVDLQAANPFPIFDSAFYQNQIFMLGEAHGSAMPQDLDFALVKHLHQKVNLRYYLAEVDYAQAHYLNEYLRTGNEEFLSYVFQFWARQNAQWGNQSFYDKIKKLRAYNQTLPQHQRISMLGVDMIQDKDALQRYLREVLPQMPTSDGNAALQHLNKIVMADSLVRDSLYLAARKALAYLAQDTTEKGLAQGAYFNLQHTLRNVGYLQQKTRRDSVMYLNLNTLVQARNLQQEKMYGMWGLFHTIPVEVERGIPFAYLLQSQNSAFKGKAVSIGVYTLDSESMMPAAALPAFLGKGERYVNSTLANNDGPMVFIDGIKDLRAVTRPNSITLFKTGAPGSPYRSSSRLASIQVLFPNQSIAFAGENPTVAAVFPYICLIRNSKALTPLALQ